MLHADSIINNIPASKNRLEDLREESSRDPVIQRAMKYTLSGWPKHQRDVPNDLHNIFKEKEMLSVIDGLLVFGSRIVVPTALQDDILKRLHHGHLGTEKCIQRAKQSVWWPGLASQIKELIQKCHHCQINAAKQRKEPLQPSRLPDRPWQRVAADLCFLKGKHYLVMVDYYSRYLEVVPTTEATDRVIDITKTIFARHGVPEELVTDNGPQFASHTFTEFAKAWGFRHVTTSPHHPSANGEAEHGVQTVKKILKQNDPFLALLSYRSTPSKTTGFAPAQLLMGRQLRSTVPCLPAVLQPAWPDAKLVRMNDETAKARYALDLDQRHGARGLPPLENGQSVLIRVDQQKSWGQHGTIVGTGPLPRSYLVQTSHGILRRNRCHLRPFATSESSPVSRHVPSRVPTTSVSMSEHVPDPVAPTSVLGHERPRRSVKRPNRLIECT